MRVRVVNLCIIINSFQRLFRFPFVLINNVFFCFMNGWMYAMCVCRVYDSEVISLLDSWHITGYIYLAVLAVAALLRSWFV